MIAISERIAAWSAGLRIRDVPPAVQRRAQHLMLDALGVGIAASTMDFAARSRQAVAALAADSRGEASGIGIDRMLPVRDAVLLNGTMIHGIDFDDTYLPGTVHPSASAVAVSLAVAEAKGLSSDALLLAYITALEVTGRVAAAAANGGLIAGGFHPTGVAAAFGCSVAAAQLFGLTEAETADAQGFVGSLTSGSMAFVTDGSWTKRAHPGWAGVAGIVAAAHARVGFPSPRDIYEGDLGFYASHAADPTDVDLDRRVGTLGTEWITTEIAVKPLPACHYTHALSDAALEIQRGQRVTDRDIEQIVCRIAAPQVPVIFEPLAAKQRPSEPYAAQFSGPYVVAASIIRGGFGLAELEEEVLRDERVLSLAQRVTYEIDPYSSFPEAFSGEVIVRTFDGREFRHREAINRGAQQRPIEDAAVVAKFRANAALRMSERDSEALERAVLDGMDARAIGPLVRTESAIG